MATMRRIAHAVCAGLALLVFAGPAEAKGRPAPAVQSEVLSPREAAERARVIQPGKVLSVQLVRREGRPAYYHVKILRKGKLLSVDIPVER
jgi:hypothetical protein